MKYLLFVLIVLVLFPFAGTAQKKAPLQGYFDYKASVTLPDSNVVVSSWNVRIYTNDTLVRVETETQLGMQVYIRHLVLNKAYLLLDFNGKHYAIQTDLEKNKTVSDPDSLKTHYTFKKKAGTTTINGIKCRKYRVKDVQQNQEYDCYFAKKIPNKYLEVYREIPGLAIDYFLTSPEGLIRYELKGLTLAPVNRDLFGVPSDYERISFEEFVNLFSAE